MAASICMPLHMEREFHLAIAIQHIAPSALPYSTLYATVKPEVERDVITMYAISAPALTGEHTMTGDFENVVGKLIDTVCLSAAKLTALEPHWKESFTTI